MEALNDIQLNDSMIAQLYGRSLVDIRANASTTNIPPSAPSSLKYLGNNLKQVTILVCNPLFTFLPEDQLAFLAKMLGACKMNMGDIAIVNMVSTPFEDVIQELSPRFLIAFGYDIQQPLLQAHQQNGIFYLSSPALDELVKETDEAKSFKTRLWGSLRQMFAIQ